MRYRISSTPRYCIALTKSFDAGNCPSSRAFCSRLGVAFSVRWSDMRYLGQQAGQQAEEARGVLLVDARKCRERPGEHRTAQAPSLMGMRR